MHPGGDHLRSEAVGRECVEIVVPPGPAGLDVLVVALRAALDGTGPAVALVPGTGSSEYRERVRAAVRPGEPVPAGVAVVASTSGSTGNPAGVLLPATALRSAAAGFAERTGQRAHQWVAALPLHSAGGLMVAVRSVLSGTPPLALPTLGGAGRFTAQDFVEATESARGESPDGMPLAVSLVPAMLAELAGAGVAALRALRHYDVVLGGGAATPGTLDARLTAEGVRLMRSYGMTETCGGAVFDGIPLTGVRVSVHPGGRLRVTGAQVAAGYRDDRQPERWGVDAAGERWFVTDDVGDVSASGSVTVLGRSDDVVQVGGASVSVAAVAEVLRAEDRVAFAEVVAVPDDRLGTRLVAVVVPTRGACARSAHSGVRSGSQQTGSLPGDDPARRRADSPREGESGGRESSDRIAPRQPLADTLADRVAAALGRSARPRVVRLVPAIPMLESGKPDRQALTRIAEMPPEARWLAPP